MGQWTYSSTILKFSVFRNHINILDDPLNRGRPLARSTYTEHKHRKKWHQCPEWDSNPRSQCWASRKNTPLRPRGHFDRDKTLFRQQRNWYIYQLGSPSHTTTCLEVATFDAPQTNISSPPHQMIKCGILWVIINTTLSTSLIFVNNRTLILHVTQCCPSNNHKLQKLAVLQ
jgi:hypothetical protein